MDAGAIVVRFGLDLDLMTLFALASFGSYALRGSERRFGVDYVRLIRARCKKMPDREGLAACARKPVCKARDRSLNLVLAITNARWNKGV